jgi:hypothetical protein
VSSADAEGANREGADAEGTDGKSADREGTNAEGAHFGVMPFMVLDPGIGFGWVTIRALRGDRLGRNIRTKRTALVRSDQGLLVWEMLGLLRELLGEENLSDIPLRSRPVGEPAGHVGEALNGLASSR